MTIHTKENSGKPKPKSICNFCDSENVVIYDNPLIHDVRKPNNQYKYTHQEPIICLDCGKITIRKDPPLTEEEKIMIKKYSKWYRRPIIQMVISFGIIFVVVVIWTNLK